LFEMIRAGAHRAYRVRNVETVKDGERLDLPGRPRVVATPGHTNGHAGYLFESYRVLCSGDALVTDGVITRRTGPQLMEKRFHADPVQAKASLEILARQDADVILPGHGPPWRGSPAEAVELARG
jgi:glyoxylase-like metal-dependent hydrolase (beta-lactamase superfamily II)